MKKSTAIELLGGVTQLAEALCIKPQAVSQWGEDVPKLRSYEIKELLNKKKHNASVA